MTSFASRVSTVSIASAFSLTVAFPAPVAAQSREQRQLMADVRIVQEQNQVLQNLLGSLAEAIKAVNARIDEQANVTGKALADQKLLIDSLATNVREIREKLDDNTVRLGSLSQEVDAVRQGLQQLSTPPPLGGTAPIDPGTTGATPATSGAAAPGDGGTVAPPIAPPVAIGTSPQKLWDEAWADYTLSQWDLAIAGFEAVIKYFPRAERAADAQVYIGHSYFQAGQNDKAIEAYDAAIRNYPSAPAIPEAYYKKGIALKNLKQVDAAREAFEYIVKTYPDSAAASLAKQQIVQPARPN